MFTRISSGIGLILSTFLTYTGYINQIPDKIFASIILTLIQYTILVFGDGDKKCLGMIMYS